MNMNIQASTNHSNEEISNSLIREVINAPVTVAAEAICDNEVEMMSIGTQTPYIYCYSCGNIKPLICMTKTILNAELSSIAMTSAPLAIIGNDDNDDDSENNETYSNNDDTYDNEIVNDEIDSDIDSYCTSDDDARSVQSSTSLGSLEIKHTPRNQAELLLQSIQRTAKANAAKQKAKTLTAVSESKIRSVGTSVKKYKSTFHLKQCHQSDVTFIKNSYINDNNNRNNNNNYNHSERAVVAETLAERKDGQTLQNNDENIIITNVTVIKTTPTTTVSDGNNISLENDNIMMTDYQFRHTQETQYNTFYSKVEQESAEELHQTPDEGIIESTDYPVTSTTASVVIPTSNIDLNKADNIIKWENFAKIKPKRDNDDEILDEECFETITKITPLVKQCSVKITKTTTIAPVSKAIKEINHYHKTSPASSLKSSKENNQFNNENGNQNNKNNGYHHNNTNCDVITQFETPTNENRTNQMRTKIGENFTKRSGEQNIIRPSSSTIIPSTFTFDLSTNSTNRSLNNLMNPYGGSSI